MKTVIYARYSPGPNQTEQSIEGQVRDCTEYALSHDLNIVGEYIDRKISGKSDDRQNFQKMIKDSEKGIFEAVLVYKMDRFARNRYDSAIYKAKLKKNGIKIFYAKEAIPDGPEGIILESLLEGMAEYYSEELSQKIRRGQRESAYKCRLISGHPPLGYKVDKDKKFILDVDTVPVVLKIFNMYNEGYPVKTICDELNELDIKTSTGGAFNKNSLRKILKNEKYIGVYESHGVRIDGGVPAIVTPEIFASVQKRLELNKRTPAKAKAKVEYLLTGKLYCGKCGEGMVGESGTGKSGTKHTYYICSSKKRYKTCKKGTVKKAWLEQLVVEQTVKYVLNPDTINYIAKKCVKIYKEDNKNNNEIEYLKKQLTDTQKSISNVMAAIEQGIITPTTKTRLTELEQAKDKLEFEIDMQKLKQPNLTEKHIIFMLSQFQQAPDEAYEEYGKKIIDCFVNSVILNDEDITIKYNLTGENEEYKNSIVGLDKYNDKEHLVLQSSDLTPLCPYTTSKSRFAILI